MGPAFRTLRTPPRDDAGAAEAASRRGPGQASERKPGEEEACREVDTQARIAGNRGNADLSCNRMRAPHASEYLTYFYLYMERKTICFGLNGVFMFFRDPQPAVKEPPHTSLNAALHATHESFPFLVATVLKMCASRSECGKFHQAATSVEETRKT